MTFQPLTAFGIIFARTPLLLDPYFASVYTELPRGLLSAWSSHIYPLISSVLSPVC